MPSSRPKPPVERERKFLVDRPPPGLARFPHDLIRQGYLAIDERAEVRVRHKGARHLLTVKGGRGPRRAEVEFPVPAYRFRQLWPLTDGRRVRKTRYDIPYDGLTIELDVYAGDLRGLRTAEVEFDSGRQSAAFRPPAWFGPEVTDDPAYSNQSLACHGLPQAVARRAKKGRRQREKGKTRQGEAPS